MKYLALLSFESGRRPAMSAVMDSQPVTEISIEHPKGSAAFRIVEYLAKHGETPGVVLAREIGFDNSATRGMTQYAVRRGLIAIRKEHGRNFYRLLALPAG
jgi:hypothetical protein